MRLLRVPDLQNIARALDGDESEILSAATHGLTPICAIKRLLATSKTSAH